ncbi:MAG: CHAT domain-containing protein, partial [Anaerolineales bacterium]
MIEYTDLEIGLHRREAQTYAVELRVNQPDSQADTLHTGTAHFDFDALRRDHLKPAAYGQRLFQNLFADDAVREAFRKAQSDERPLRVRLFIGPSAPELHTLRWETLRDPEANAPLFTGERLLFSRYLGSPDWRPVRLRPASGLSALVVVADPSDVADYEGLAPLAVESEINRARASLGEKILMTALPD